MKTRAQEHRYMHHALAPAAGETGGGTEKQTRKTNGKCFVPDEDGFTAVSLNISLNFILGSWWDDIANKQNHWMIPIRTYYALFVGRASYPNPLHRICRKTELQDWQPCPEVLCEASHTFLLCSRSPLSVSWDRGASLDVLLILSSLPESSKIHY